MKGQDKWMWEGTVMPEHSEVMPPHLMRGEQGEVHRTGNEVADWRPGMKLLLAHSWQRQDLQIPCHIGTQWLQQLEARDNVMTQRQPRGEGARGSLTVTTQSARQCTCNAALSHDVKCTDRGMLSGLLVHLLHQQACVAEAESLLPAVRPLAAVQGTSSHAQHAQCQSDSHRVPWRPQNF